MGVVESLVGGALLGGALSIGQASQRNDSIRKQAGNAEAAAQLQAQQLAERRAQQLDQNKREAAALRGRLLASAAARGASGVGTSTDAFGTSILGSLSNANRVTEKNYGNALQQVRLGTQSSIDQLFANYQSPVLSGLTGALGGASTGLQVSNGYNQLFPKKDPVESFLWSGR